VPLTGLRHTFRFGPFLLDPHERQLLRDEQPLSIAPKVFDALLLLVENRGHLVQKEFLVNRLWPETAVEENNLSQCIYVLRKILGGSSEEGSVHYIETVPRRGYRFIAPVERLSTEPAIIELNDAAAVASSKVQFRPSSHSSRIVATAALIIVLLLAVVGLLRYSLRSNASPPQLPQKMQSMAVLPFESLNSTSENAVLGVALADALITRLSGNHEMNICPLERVRRYSGSAVDPLRAGRELRVAAVLHGSIQREAAEVRITMQLLNVADGRLLWADKLDSDLDDMFALEDSVAADAARALLPSHVIATRASRPATANVEAYEDYVKARFFWSKRTSESLTTAVDFFQQAIAKDPEYAQAYAGLADAYALLGFYDFLPPAESYPKAKQAALKALALDSDIAEAHASLLNIETDYDWDWVAADREFKRAIKLNPNYAAAYQWHAYVHLANRDIQGALADLNRAMQLDPTAPGINISLAWPYYLDRKYDASARQCVKTIELYPEFVVAHQVLAMNYTQRGQYSQALAELAKVQALERDNPMTDLLFSHLYAVSGRRADSEDRLRVVLASKRRFKVPSYYVAAVYAALGLKHDSLNWLDRAYAERSNWMIYLNIDPRFDSLHGDPGFEGLVKRIGSSS
jgi:DNA-binding winged helix-turn-helix (wHTH) protein/TolB-like protein/Tfp pilus assembly protein PilF